MAEPALERLLEGALRRALDDPHLRLLALQPLAGGCIHTAARLDTSAGPFFAKWDQDGTAPDELFACEAAGLRALAQPGGGALVVPRPLWVEGRHARTPALLVCEYLERRPARAGDEEAMGRGLAELHRRGAPRFGFDGPSYCGSTRQDNTPADDWAEFFAQRRLGMLVRALDRQGRLAPGERGLYERLCARLPDRLAHRPAPALIHGDLWSGNVLYTPRGPALVDPAVAWADREAEFGIGTLFGGLSERVCAAYDETWPRPPGWRERLGLYQLYHLLNHQLLFGGAYGAQALALARRYA